MTSRAEQIISLRDAGLTYAAIGEAVGVTKQAVHSTLRRHGLLIERSPTPKLPHRCPCNRYCLAYARQIRHECNADTPKVPRRGSLERARNPERDEEVLHYRRAGLTLQSIADIYGVTPTAIICRLRAIRRRKSNARPSKQKPRTGYRSDPVRHQAARSKVSPERRKEIARMGAVARAKKASE